MPFLKGTLEKLGTRTARYGWIHRRRIMGRLIPWPPFVRIRKYETKHYYVLKKRDGRILKTLRMPLFDYIWTWEESINYKEYLLTFTEVHELIFGEQYDNYKEWQPDNYIGKDIEVWTDVKDHKHYGLFPEHYPFKIEESADD